MLATTRVLPECVGKSVLPIVVFHDTCHRACQDSWGFHGRPYLGRAQRWHAQSEKRTDSILLSVRQPSLPLVDALGLAHLVYVCELWCFILFV